MCAVMDVSLTFVRWLCTGMRARFGRWGLWVESADGSDRGSGAHRGTDSTTAKPCRNNISCPENRAISAPSVRFLNSKSNSYKKQHSSSISSDDGGTIHAPTVSTQPQEGTA
jgi:hypothetical protein